MYTLRRPAPSSGPGNSRRSEPRIINLNVGNDAVVPVAGAEMLGQFGHQPGLDPGRRDDKVLPIEQVNGL